MAAEMKAQAAKSPALREQYLEMAQRWERLERSSAQMEGVVRPDRREA